ncbi:MAG TPA: hypothetical protein VGM18_10815 [Candidatus Sulfotelmatobacter sp.]|jgi:hypothetical protein
MKITQAWGWLVAGVLAAGLNAGYHDGGLEWAHQLADRVQNRAEMVIDRASEGAERLVAQAQMIAARNETDSCRLSGALAQLQSRIDRTMATKTRIADNSLDRSQRAFDRFEAMSAREQARQQAHLDRFLASRARMQARIAVQAAHMRMAAFAPTAVKVAPMACPRVHVSVPRMPTIKVPAIPEMHIETGAGPV